MGHRARAILWAQWRTLRNHLPRSNKLGMAFGAFLAVIWYGSFTVFAMAAASIMASPEQMDTIAKVLPGAMVLAFLYWQVIPILLASTGSSLDTRKMLLFPVAKHELFLMEVLLRFTTGIEVLIVFLGAAVGEMFNPRIPAWAPLSLALFSIFNLFVSAGIRDLLTRLLTRKIVREILVIVFVLAAALPQLLLMRHPDGNPFERLLTLSSGVILPWMAAATLAMGQWSWPSLTALLVWTLAALGFSWRQFERTMLFDPEESSSSVAASSGRSKWNDALFALPGRLFGDPMAAMVEKELRCLSRSPRFRLVFLMGFSFGLLIWLPITFSNSGINDSWMGRNYLAAVSIYALLLLSDTLFWNVFGFDRGSAQLYFLTPVEMTAVLRAKNIAAMFYVFLDVLMVAAVCFVLQFPMSASKLSEAFAVTLVTALLLMAIGNMSSAYNPKPVDPGKSFRSGTTRQTQVLMFIFPVALAPVGLAYAARYAFDTEVAFWGVLALEAIFAAIVYRIGTESAVAATEGRKEAMIDALSKGEGPIGS